MNKITDYPLTVFRGNDDAELDSAGETYWAYCRELDCLGDGDTPAAAMINCQEGMGLKLRALRVKGIPEPEPSSLAMNREFSGKIMVRLPKSLHRSLVEEASEEDISLNHYISNCLAVRHRRFFDQEVSLTMNATTIDIPAQSKLPPDPSDKIILFNSWQTLREG